MQRLELLRAALSTLHLSRTRWRRRCVRSRMWNRSRRKRETDTDRETERSPCSDSIRSHGTVDRIRVQPGNSSLALQSTSFVRWFPRADSGLDPDYQPPVGRTDRDLRATNEPDGSIEMFVGDNRRCRHVTKDSRRHLTHEREDGRFSLQRISPALELRVPGEVSSAPLQRLGQQLAIKRARDPSPH